MPGMLEQLLATLMQRGALGPAAGFTPGSATGGMNAPMYDSGAFQPPAPGASLDLGVSPFGQAGEFPPAPASDESAAVESAHEAARKRLRRSMGRMDGEARSFPGFSPPVSTLGMLGLPENEPAPIAMGPAGDPEGGAVTPPETNDPMSAEPVAFKGGVPLPRERPVSATDMSSARGGVPRDESVAAPMSLAPPVQGQAGPAGGPGGFDVGGMLSKFLKPENAPMLLAMAGGFGGAGSIGTGMRRGFSAAAPMAALRNKEEKATMNQGETYRALIARGATPTEAMAAVKSPEVLKATIAKYFETKPAQVVNGRLVREKPDGTIELLGDYSDDKDKDGPKLSAGYRWKDVNDKSKGQEFIPDGPADPKIKAQAARQSEPPKYEWVDPLDHSKGQRAIPGGGAERVDANVAARLGLAQSFLDQLPDIRKGIKAGEATGLWDGAMGKLNVGRAGELRRQIDSGAESLLRNLTGAGMNKEEATDYTRRYRLDATDTAATVASKLAQLERELQYTMEAVRKGRGGTIKVSNGALVSTDGAAPAATGKTSTNVPFKILQ